MEIVLFRVVLAPSMVLLASLAARKLGPGRGGELLGAPTTTGPFLMLLCWTRGRVAGAEAAHGSVTGQLAVATFCLVYGRFAARSRPWRAQLTALAATGIAGVIGVMTRYTWLTAAVTLAVVLVGLRTWPAHRSSPRALQAASGWQIPVRMLLAGATVLAAAGAARVFGSYTGGMFAALPVLLAVMAPSLHRSAGPQAAADLTRGALISAAGTTCFLLLLATSLQRLGPLTAFPLALGAMLLMGYLVRGTLVTGVGSSRTSTP